MTTWEQQEFPIRPKLDDSTRKEVIEMTYTRPELFVLASAPVAIRNGESDASTLSQKGIAAVADVNFASGHTSESAYEADE